ncbi:NUDIX hydrolase [Peribacillus deserti]|uniref:NUDIX hydrolase n=1 Tax=Peribacillus deserti TaxID=673318 RepID=A0A2N5M2P8_9BACI|nr:NUDIX domain-containing protein [Peribacillus deserti]PLT28646.1 NUDIX hydrolase [Peribacillus deserti]
MGMSAYYKNLREKVGNELIFMPSVACIVRNEGGEILLQNKGNGEPWSLPAGAIEPGETPADAAAREVQEETGLTITPKRLAGVFGGKEYRYQYPNGHQVEYNIFLFECEINHGELLPLDNETAELCYFKPENMPELALPYPKSLFIETDRQSVYYQHSGRYEGER